MYMFVESPNSGDGPVPGFEFLVDMVPEDTVFVTDMDAGSTLYHFANADMLVNTGESGTKSIAVGSGSLTCMFCLL